jgi:hypothetical protein
MNWATTIYRYSLRVVVAQPEGEGDGVNWEKQISCFNAKTGLAWMDIKIFRVLQIKGGC